VAQLFAASAVVARTDRAIQQAQSGRPDYRSSPAMNIYKVGVIGKRCITR
jgi:hypothetical protein